MKTLLFSTALIASASAEPAITIYNQNLAVVRETVPLNLKAGENTLNFNKATALVLPDSVVLRDPTAKHEFSILEQSYRNDPVSQGLLLSQFEGQTLEFRTVYPDGKVETVQGKVIRSGYLPGGELQDPIIEVDGKLRFSLPGQPQFPALGDDSVLKPTLGWRLDAETPAKFDAQLSYLTSGFSWSASYNLVAPEKGDTVTLAGWITIANNSGTAFDKAKVKLVAGDVNIVQPMADRSTMSLAAPLARTREQEKVEEKAFDDFHLYSLPRTLTIRDKETKQVEFLRSPEVKAVKRYVYDPASQYRFYGGVNSSSLEGTEFSKDISINWEFKNSKENGLGVPLPAGRVRFYRTDDKDGNLEFVGENNIDHTPQNEELSIYTGNAFDLVGERKITNFQVKEREHWMKETIEITLKNRSKEPKEITAREQLWRWSNWKIEDASMESVKKDSHTIEFTAKLAPDEVKTITYTAHYTW